MKNAPLSMGGTEIGPFLREAARKVDYRHAVVEVGTWLGAGTRQIAMGLADAGRGMVQIYCFDRFTANAYEVEKAAEGGLVLHLGQDTRPVVSERVLPLHRNLVLNRCNICDAVWDPRIKIGMYVDDAAKRTSEFLHKLKTFGPSWVPGKTSVFLMDLYFYKKNKGKKHYKDLLGQQRFVDRFPDVLVHQRDLGLNGASFLYQRPMDFDKLTLKDLQ